MYDFYLGGKDNFEADRVAAEEIMRLVPVTRAEAMTNRQFLRLAVRYLATDARGSAGSLRHRRQSAARARSTRWPGKAGSRRDAGRL